MGSCGVSGVGLGWGLRVQNTRARAGFGSYVWGCGSRVGCRVWGIDLGFESEKSTLKLQQGLYEAFSFFNGVNRVLGTRVSAWREGFRFEAFANRYRVGRLGLLGPRG